MGVESANYRYVPPREAGLRVDAILRQLGCREIESGGDTARKYVLDDGDYWIDVQVEIDPWSKEQIGVGIRVAYINPLAVVKGMRVLVTALLRRGGGKIIDIATRERFSVIDEVSWDFLWKSFIGRRDKFRHDYGDCEAAISGDAVFGYLREQGLR